ncbi:riboflavin synthase subunit alpha [endosymbiont of Acanthamoeba sp. UWC8]|uniref:riboflavin synthase n=1 Tax=endosymbiont of Acanthamoeba sp. UWC8 TaxID=86106 RepID=UPI0004D16E91|nr:riboflavin synthase [endosymbiont of Acanthamoeba sp. UWC8]AIF80668.1 riboflavin synthase subunit alpha [endosymbiont of Acanthamoeba sp. UWC8]
MFNGIVEGTLKLLSKTLNNNSCVMELERLETLDDLKIGGSIAINGVCLTVTELTNYKFVADLMPETLNVTALGDLKPGSIVNYERCMKLSSRIEGHLVKGHVDEIGVIEEIYDEGNAKIIKVSVSENIAPYLIKKGSIAIDGMSITIISVENKYFTVGLIPHTVNNTAARVYKAGTKVNLEVDDMAKYMWNFMQNNLLSKAS